MLKHEQNRARIMSSATRPDIAGLTAAAAVEKYFFGASTGGDRHTDDRVWGHDFIHTMLGTDLASGRSEEITAIYQAVLLRSSQCTTAKKPWCDGGEMPSLEQIKEVTIPRTRRFVEKFLVQQGKKPGVNGHLNDEEIDFHYQRAQRFGDRIHMELGHFLGTLPVWQIKTMPIEGFIDILHKVDELSYLRGATQRMLTGRGFISL